MPTPSPSQLAAIEAPAGPMLVLAGPGAGKTFCLIARIEYLIKTIGIAPERICAFTFTNKAAGEIASRLEEQLGSTAAAVKRGTIHSLCVQLLREFSGHIGLEPGFGIADEEDQRAVLRRLEVPKSWQSQLLKRFSTHRLRGDDLWSSDPPIYAKYLESLAKRNMLDFDMLVVKAAELLRDNDAGGEIRSRWDYVLVDEFQDLNRVQYSLVRELARDHHNVFAVGDDEQSIFSWSGADARVFELFASDFGAGQIQLLENWRCPRHIVALGRRLLAANTPLFADREHALGSDRETPLPVEVWAFPDDGSEVAWVIGDIRADRAKSGMPWGSFAILYSTNATGSDVEAAFLSAGIPCRLARGRALSEDPVAGYLIAALRVIERPDDDVPREHFLQAVLPGTLFDAARAKSETTRSSIVKELISTARDLGKDHGDAKRIWRAWYALKNLPAIAKRHSTLHALVEEVLSQRVGERPTVLEELHYELLDPFDDDDVHALATDLTRALEQNLQVWVRRQGGLEIPLKGLLLGAGFSDVRCGAAPAGAIGIEPSRIRSMGLALGLFKSLQLVRSRSFTNRFRDFTTIDLETTDKDPARAEVVEVAAVRVRDGKLVDEFSSLVRPRVAISAGAQEKHGISEEDVADAPFFEDILPVLRTFCGQDTLVAHNGYGFDFPVITRMAAAAGKPWALSTYDTLPLAREVQSGSRQLPDLAKRFGIDTGQSHRALDDTRTLARVFLALEEARMVRDRKTVLADLLDHLGMALAMENVEAQNEEERLLRRRVSAYPLGRYSDALDFYGFEREAAADASLPTVDDIIDLLGGATVMARMRADKSVDDRYPAAMTRLRKVLADIHSDSLSNGIQSFLERIHLSTWDGVETTTSRVNLLTLHSAKGLEFSRVYVVGVEDCQFPPHTLPKSPDKEKVDEARRLLYVGMTRTVDRLVLTRAQLRRGVPTGGQRFLEEMELIPQDPTADTT